MQKNNVKNFSFTLSLSLDPNVLNFCSHKLHPYAKKKKKKVTNSKAKIRVGSETLACPAECISKSFHIPLFKLERARS